MAAGVEKEVVGRSFNVASGKGMTVREAFHLVAQQIEIVTGRGVEIENTPWPEGVDPIEFRNFVADITSFQNATGWRPRISLNEGVNRMISSFINKSIL